MLVIVSVSSSHIRARCGLAVKTHDEVAHMSPIHKIISKLETCRPIDDERQFKTAKRPRAPIM